MPRNLPSAPLPVPPSAPSEAPGSSLPGYSVRVSRKARRILVRVLPEHRVEVVLPLGVPASCVPDVLSRHREWIRKTLERMAPREEEADTFPAFLSLRGGRECVILRHTGRNALALTPFSPRTNTPFIEQRELILPAFPFAVAQKPEKALGWLRNWVKEEAAHRLIPSLNDAADTYGFSFSGCSVRLQKTRWGSCSARGRINLNACLIFLPDALARYVLLHELCHTRQMNHAEGFWKQLFAVEPDALRLDKALRGAWRHVPWWMRRG